MKRLLLVVALVLAAIPAKAADWLFPATSYSVTYANTAVSSTYRVSPYVEAVRLIATTDSWISLEYTPIAVAATGMYLRQYEGVTLAGKPGVKISVIGPGTNTGTLYITEMTR